MSDPTSDHTAYVGEWLARGDSGRRYLRRTAAADRLWLERQYGSVEAAEQYAERHDDPNVRHVAARVRAIEAAMAAEG